jgi:acyl dehydratase
MAEAPVRPGDRFTASRHITAEDVSAFGYMVDDRAEQHDASDGQPAVVHGLFLAALPFAITSKFGYLGTRVQLGSDIPAFAGSTVDVSVEVEDVETGHPLGWRVRLLFQVVDDRGRVVLDGRSEGLIPYRR